MPLAVAVTGDISAFQKAMAAATTVAGKAAEKIAEDFIASKVKMDRAFGALKFGAAAVGGLIAIKLALDAVQAASDAAMKALAEVVKVGTDATKLGVGTDFLQHWRDSARALNLEVKQLDAMLEKARESSTVSLGTGPDAPTSDILKRLRQHAEVGNIVQSDVDKFTGAKDQEERIRVILDLLDKLKAKGAELAQFDLAKTFLGKDFESGLRNGVDLTGKMRAALDSMAQVKLSPELIATATETERKLAEAERLMREGWLPVQKDIAEWQLKQAASAADLKVSFAELVALLGRGYEWLTSWGKIIENMGNASIWRKLADLLPRTGSVEDAPPGGFPVPGLPKPNITGAGDTSKNLPGPKKSAAAEATEQKTALDRFIDQQKKSNAEAQTQAEMVGASNLEYKTALALAQARVAAERDFTDKKREQKGLTETEIATITHLAEVQERAREAARQFGALQMFAGQQLVSALDKATESGAKLSDILLDVTKAIKTAAIQALVLGQGPLAGLFGTGGGQAGQAGPGSLIGLLSAGIKALPKYADGGVVPGTGPQLAMVHGGETIIPRGSSGGGPIMITQTIDARGAQLGVGDQIAAALAANNRALQITLPSMIRNASSRGSMR